LKKQQLFCQSAWPVFQRAAGAFTTQKTRQWLSAFAEALRNEELDFCTIASQAGSLFEKPGFGLPLRLDEADSEDLANQLMGLGSDCDEILIVRGSNDSRTGTQLFVVASPEKTLALATRVMDVLVKQQQAREAKSHEDLFAD
jgi:hypothetical protein